MKTKQSEVYKGLGITNMVNKVVEVPTIVSLMIITGLPCNDLCLRLNRFRQDIHNGGIRLCESIRECRK